MMPVFPKLSDKQQECLKFIYDFYTANLYYPSRRELAEAIHATAASANQHIEALIKKGYLLRVAGESRNIRVNPDTLEVLKHLGIIKGGEDEKES